MSQFIRAAWISAIAAICFAAAVLAGVRGAEASVANSGQLPAACCIYMIF